MTEFKDIQCAAGQRRWHTYTFLSNDQSQAPSSSKPVKGREKGTIQDLSQ